MSYDDQTKSARRWRTTALLALGVAIGSVLAATPVYSHVGGSVSHLWGQHIKPKADDRYANAVPGTDKARNAARLDGLSSDAFVRADGGRAFAYGQVRADGSLRPHSDTVVESTPGFVGHPSTGLYCIAFTPTPTQAQLEGSAVTLSGTTAQALFPHITNGQGGDCGAGELAIRFYNASGTLTDARFMFLVP